MTQDDSFNPCPGHPEDLGQDIRRILAPNPSPMTFRGTNSYLLGRAGLAVIDPGPDDPAHLQAILDAVQPGQRITHILVTHAHLDHSPLAARLSAATGAPVLAYGPASAGRSAVMQKLADTGLRDGGEGIDHSFLPDNTLADGQVIDGDGWRITALWTPGHLGNHMCFAMGDVVFTGDLVMGWASSLVSPPDGDLTDFMASCEHLRQRPAQVFHSGHGAPITAPQTRLEWLMSHRKSREAAILAHLHNGPSGAGALAQAIYTETPPALLPAATRNVLAHLIDLMQKNKVSPLDNLSAQSRFELLVKTTKEV